MKKISLYIFLVLMFCSTAISEEIDAKVKLDEFKKDYDLLSGENKLTFCIPVFQMMKQRNVLDVYNIVSDETMSESEKKKMKNLVNEFDVIFLMETVAYFNLFKDFNLFEDLDKQSTIGKLTDEMKVSLDKNDELIQKSGNYLNKLPFSEVLKSKIYSTCSFNYLALTIESKTIKEIANKLKEPKWKKTLFESSQEEWSSMLQKVVNKNKKSQTENTLSSSESTLSSAEIDNAILKCADYEYEKDVRENFFKYTYLFVNQKYEAEKEYILMNQTSNRLYYYIVVTTKAGFTEQETIEYFTELEKRDFESLSEIEKPLALSIRQNKEISDKRLNIFLKRDPFTKRQEEFYGIKFMTCESRSKKDADSFVEKYSNIN